MNILGISAFYHDSAAALLVGGEIVAAAQEERFSRQKHDQGFPAGAIDYCLAEAGLKPADLDLVAFYDKPYLKFERLLETYLAFAPAGFPSFLSAMPSWLRQKLHLPREMRKGLNAGLNKTGDGGYKKRFVFTSHHESHAASAFFPSPFEEAAILTLDGVGEWATASLGVGRGKEITLTHELRFPHSPGLLYAAFTYYCGFKVNADEYKLMGLAPYGEPRFADLIFEHLVDLKADGSFRMDMAYFNYCQGLTMTSKKFHDLFGAAPLPLGGHLGQREMDLAASVQFVIEEIMLRMARHAQAETGLSNLCLAGGVALNCVGNGRIQREGPFEQLWIQPASDDAGGALGAALFAWHQLLGEERQVKLPDSQAGSMLGPAYDNEEIEAYLATTGAVYEKVPDEAQYCERVAEEIEAGHVIGWFQGRMEFGPRALGCRSIIGDARNTQMQSVMNMKVKFRESFRPFAPIVLREHVRDYFDIPEGAESPYMLLVAPVLEARRKAIPDDLQAAAGIDKLLQVRSEIPAVTHVDYSARVQTVDGERHDLLRSLMATFHRKTGCPVLVNTSFNLGWEPIVCTPQNAYETVMSSDIDLLCIGHFLLRKRDQPVWSESHDEESRERTLLALVASPCCADAGLIGAEATAKEATGGEACARCSSCGASYAKEAGIWRLGRRAQGLGSEAGFPVYDTQDTVRPLLDGARAGPLSAALERILPYNSRVLVAGCGSGQLSNALGISCRRIVALDDNFAALRLGEAFRAENDLRRISFVEGDPFRPPFKPAQFDALLCPGLLARSSDPTATLQHLLTLVKPGGLIVVGFENRKFAILGKLFGAGRKSADPFVSLAERPDWQAGRSLDLGTVLTWFERAGLGLLGALPALKPGAALQLSGQPLKVEERGGPLDHALVQLHGLCGGAPEAGFYLLAGRKPEEATDHGSA